MVGEVVGDEETQNGRSIERPSQIFSMLYLGGASIQQLPSSYLMKAYQSVRPLNAFDRLLVFSEKPASDSAVMVLQTGRPDQ